MATEEEGRETADGEEVQVEAVDLKPVHMQTHLGCKLPLMEIKNMGEITNSSEGTLTIPEDQILVEAPSEVEVRPEHNLNGTASSLNGHVDEEEKMSNEQLHENNNNGQKQVEAALDGAGTDQSKQISEGVNGCLSHGESTVEDSILLKYEKEEEPKGDDQQDSEGVTMDDATIQEDQLKPDNAVGQAVDGLQDQSLEPEKATEDTQPAGMANIPDVEVIADTPAGVQTHLKPNVDDSDAIPDVTDRNTEEDEPANADDAFHLDQKGLPEDTSVAEHTNEVVKVEDHTEQADAVDAEAVQEDKPICEETDLQEEKLESKPDESTIDAQEVLNQEPSEDTNGPVCEKIEETSQESDVVASETNSENDATSRDPAVNIQVHNKEESLEEKEDPEAVDTESTMQQRSLAFEEANPEDRVPTTEQISDTEDEKNEGMANKSNVSFTEPAVQEPTEDIQPVHESQQTETKSTGTYEMYEPSDQTHATVGDLAEEDAIPAAREPQVTEIAQEVKDIEATETEEIAQQDHIASSKELSTEDDSTASKPYNDDLQQTLEQDSAEVKDTETDENHQERNDYTTKDDMVEDNGTEEGPTCGSQEGDNVNSVEEIKERIAENTVSSVVSVDEADEEEKGPTTEGSTESDDTPASKKQRMESAVEIQETETTAMCEKTPAEDHKTESETQKTETTAMCEKTPAEDHITESETTSDTQEVNITEVSEAIKSDKDIKTGEISDQSNLFFAGESAQENDALESESTADIQLAQEPEAEEMENTEHFEEKKTSHETNAVVQKLTQEDNPTASELNVMASVGEASSIEGTEAETLFHQSNDDQSEEKTEENVTASETQILEPQSVEETNGIVSTPEEYTTEDNVATLELTSDTQAENLESAEVIEGTENLKSDIALADEAALEEHVQTGISPMQDPELEETKIAEPVEAEDNMASCELPEEEMDRQTMESEAIPHENPVPSINKLTEDDILVARAPRGDIQPILEQESVESTKCADTTEYPEEPQQTTVSASDELTPTEENTISTELASDTQVQNVAAQEINDSEDRKIDEISNISSFSTPEEAAKEAEESSSPRIEPASDVKQEQELGSTEVTRCIKAVEDHQQQRASGLEEVAIDSESNVYDQQVHEDKPTEVQDNEAMETEETNDIEATEPQSTSQQIISNSGKSLQEEIETEDMVPSSDTQAENLQSAEVLEDTENVKSDAALDEEAVLEEHIQIEAPVGISQVQDQELEETKDTELVDAEDNMISSHLLGEEDKETMESEEIPHENPVASIKELTEDDICAPRGDIQPIMEQESVESTKCADTTEYPEEPQQITGSASDEFTPTEEKTISTESPCDTQVQNVTALEIEDSEDRKTDEISNISSFPTPEEAAEESNTPRIEQTSDLRIEPTSDIKQEQDLGSTEETRGIESVEDHQQQRASNLEEVAIDSESNVDDHQVHEDKPTEVQDNEAMETEEVFKQSNTPANAAEETSELGSEPDQLAHQVEVSEDSECSQVLKEEESSGKSNVLTIDVRKVEDSVADEIDPPVDIKQEHELESVEEIKVINATEAEENFHTSQPDAPIEPIQQVNDTEAKKDIKGIEAINDGDISCEQTEAAILEDPSPKDNETAPEDHHVESNERNLGNGSDNAMLVHGTKDEIHTSAEQKDDACDSGETSFTTQKSENKTDEDVFQTFGEDTLQTLNNINQINAEQNAGIEHNSSQVAEEPCGENITHVQDEDIKGELLTERDTAEVSQAVFENDPQESQDVTDKDDTIKSDEQTSDDDNRQPGDVSPQPQTCESSVDDEAEQMVNLDEQEKEADNIESQKEELQEDEQIHADERDDVTTKPLVEPQHTENGTTNRTEDTDVFQAEQTEAVVTEILKNEQALHTPEESTTIIVDTKVENIAGTDEGAAEENEPNNVSTLDADSKLDNKEQEITEKDDTMAKDPTDETIDEITNEKLELGLGSSVQEISDTSPSNGQVLENDPDPIAVPQNVESANKVNDDVLAIQESEKEIVAEVDENKEMQNEDNPVRHDESQTEPEKDETSHLRSHEPCNVDTKMDDTTILPRETEEIGENKGSNSISFRPKEDNVEKDLRDHRVEEEEQTKTEQNAVTIEAMQQVDSSDADANNDNQASTSKSLPEHETESADEVMQLETKDNAFDMIHEAVSNGKTETCNTEATETETTNDDICDKAARAHGALSDKSLKTLGTVENLDAPSIVTALKEESMNEKMEDHKLALTAHPTQDENTPEQGFFLEETEREMSLSEKPVPTEPENNQIPKEQDEEDMHEPEIGYARKEVEQDLPVSHFLMNLIMGKENSDANENSEPEAEGKQEETRDDNSCLIISNQEESLVSLPAESKVEDTLTFEQEENNVKYSEQTQEVVKELSHDLKLDTEGSLETDAELNKRRFETPTYQDISEDKISSELLSEDAAGLDTKMKARDIDISNIELDDGAVDAICQEKTEVSEVTAQMGNGSLKNNIDDITNTKASEEETLAEGQTGLLCESVSKDRSTDAESEQTHLLTELDLTAATSLPSEADSVQNPVSAKQDETIESSITGVTTTPEVQLESEEVNEKGEKQHAATATATGEVAEEHVETPHDNLQKSTTSEVTSDEQAPQITKPVSDNEIALAHEKEISQSSSSKCMDEKENSNFSITEVENFQTAAEIQDDSPSMQINQDTQDEAADSQTETEQEKLGDSSFQEHQETGAEQNSSKGNDEADQRSLGKTETATKEEDVHETVESHTQTEKTNSNEEHTLFDSKIQERDFKVPSPKEIPDVEDNFVDVTKPEFSTDEEQSPTADKSNVTDEKTYDEKTKDGEETKKFTDEVKTEARGAGQKAARKKQSLLSGVGLKVKHHLAKVKKAIVGKPGHKKPESPKA